MRMVIRKSMRIHPKSEMNSKLPAQTPRAAVPEAMSLGQFLQPLRRNWGVVVLVALCGVVAALLIGYHQEPVYQATTLLELQGTNEDALNMGAPAFPANEASVEPYLQTQVKILQSPELLRRVAASLKLHDRAEFNGSHGWDLPLLRTAVRGENDRLIKEVSRHVSVRVPGQTRIIEIVAESSDPKLASDLANTVGKEYIEYTLARRAKSAQNTSEWLAGQLREQKANLERSEDALQRYANENGLVYISETNSVADAKLQQLQDALSKAQDARMQEQARYERALASAPDALPEVLDDSTLRNYQTKLTELKLHLAELSSTLMPGHYKVQEVRDQIVELEHALARGRARVLARIKNQYDSAVRREKLGAAAYGAQAGLVAAQAAKVGSLQEPQAGGRLQPALVRSHASKGQGSRHRFGCSRHQRSDSERGHGAGNARAAQHAAACGGGSVPGTSGWFGGGVRARQQGSADSRSGRCRRHAGISGIGFDSVRLRRTQWLASVPPVAPFRGKQCRRRCAFFPEAGLRWRLAGRFSDG